jgi:hypothetical protein
LGKIAVYGWALNRSGGNDQWLKQRNYAPSPAAFAKNAPYSELDTIIYAPAIMSGVICANRERLLKSLLLPSRSQAAMINLRDPIFKQEMLKKERS